MNIHGRLLAVLCAGALLLSILSCKEGPFERAGKKVDKTIKKTGEKLKEATEK